jgi:hypothetical protein
MKVYPDDWRIRLSGAAGGMVGGAIGLFVIKPLIELPPWLGGVCIHRPDRGRGRPRAGRRLATVPAFLWWTLLRLTDALQSVAWTANQALHLTGPA